MALLALAEVYEVRNICTSAFDGALNVRHYQVTAIAGAGSTDILMALQIAGVVKPLYQALMTTAAQWASLSVRRVRPGPPLGALDSGLPAGAGLVAGDPLPRQVSGLATLRTGFPGRAERGRMYIPYPSETDSDISARPIATYITRLNTLITAWITPIDIGSPIDHATVTPVVWHRATETTTIINSAVSRPNWATQRRRNNNRF